MSALFRWWRKRQRSIDLQILWPVCRREASNIQDARGAFYVHCMMDQAWIADFTEDQIIETCEALT